MAVGLEIVNDSGFVQIVDTAPILSLEKTKSVDNTSFRFSDRVYFSTTRVVATEPADGHHLIVAYDPFGGGEIDPYTGKNMMYYAVGKGNIHIFQHNQPPTSNNFGLDVFSSNGNLQFSSSQKPLRVLDFVNISDVRASTWSKDYQGKRVAAITSRRPVRSGAGQFITKGIHRSASTYFLSEASEGQDPLGGVTPSYNFQALMIDVTNY